MAFMDNRIRGFDGLRAIAVLMVFLQHRVLSSRDETGHLGVWIFFALSGFLITGILSAQRRTIEKGASDFFAFCFGGRCAFSRSITCCWLSWQS
jgi:peptidoglycan/LPS O-acetylase OafA/YrhL